jgi:hypothetical protein
MRSRNDATVMSTRSSTAHGASRRRSSCVTLKMYVEMNGAPPQYFCSWGNVSSITVRICADVARMFAPGVAKQ